MGPVWAHIRTFGQDHALVRVHPFLGKLRDEREGVRGPQEMLLDMDQSHPRKDIFVVQPYCYLMLH